MPFKKGNVEGRQGRPKGSKNKFTKFKDELIKSIYKRKNELSKCRYEDLLRVWASLMPKDLSVGIHPEERIEYISHTPRPEIEKQVDKLLEGKELEEEAKDEGG